MKNKLQIIEENSRWIVANKPAGLLSIPDRYDEDLPSVYSILKEKYGEIFTVHRLDKETSGVILFARDAETHKSLNKLFARRQMQKKYRAIVQGVPFDSEWSIKASISKHRDSKGKYYVKPGAKVAETKVLLVEAFSEMSLLELQPISGRTHQIRVHLQFAGFPLVTDSLYSLRTALKLSEIKGKKYNRKKDVEERPLLQRSALHAYSLSFELDGEQYHYSQELPKDMRAVVYQLTKRKARENPA